MYSCICQFYWIHSFFQPSFNSLSICRGRNTKIKTLHFPDSLAARILLDIRFYQLNISMQALGIIFPRGLGQRGPSRLWQTCALAVAGPKPHRLVTCFVVWAIRQERALTSGWQLSWQGHKAQVWISPCCLCLFVSTQLPLPNPFLLKIPGVGCFLAWTLNESTVAFKFVEPLVWGRCPFKCLPIFHAQSTPVIDCV